MGRELRRVPVDFDWPLNEVWCGFLMPDTLRLEKCTACDGDGLSREARAIAETFYAHQISLISHAHASTLAWHDKLGQAEVDHLVERGYLRKCVRREPTPDEPRDWDWVSVPRTAAEVNAANTKGGLLGECDLDCGARHTLIAFRCDRLGIQRDCQACGGRGEVGTDAQHAAIDAWTPTDPPTGDGWQVWETVSEGSPITPVFATRGELVGWLVEHDGQTFEAAMAFTEDGAGWVPSMVISGGVMYRGIEAAVPLKKETK